MDDTDIRLVEVLEEGLPLVPLPFVEIGNRLGIPQGEVMDRIRHLKETGIIRKIRARIDQRKMGITANALVAWKPPAGSGREAAVRFAAFESVTHCYERRPVPGRWEFTHYTVHHGYSREEVLSEIRAIAEKTGCPEYLVLFSTREYKRVPHVRIRRNGSCPR
jgi:DNA-binding Lrp family transcriptional regulator